MEAHAMADVTLDRARTAVLCLDVQNFTTAYLPGEVKEPLFGSIRTTLDGARKAQATVIYVVSARRPEFTSPRNKFLATRNQPTASPEVAAQRVRIVDAVAPVGDEPVVGKPRMSAFYGSELQSLLIGRDIDTVALMGVATNFVVESTARSAVDLDYRVIVLADCCTSATPADHERALANMEPLAHIMGSKEFLSALSR
jgi:nicotinamidase-related amidase